MSCRKAGVQCVFSPRSLMGRPRARRHRGISQTEMQREASAAQAEWAPGIYPPQMAGPYLTGVDISFDEACLTGDKQRRCETVGAIIS
ncbi:uncharacterized protein RCC_05301 [Ramularia collo-cygni]|uniref:Uncharacterized protein n=1 Tax=Ramularia collo-cygni TaxID=112498 RepID=A0A2D3V1V1_9PEZI|nr:uncharacterized protein RCC_05301 [Ramularia collo-cygni]CZT19450.1 uncharacterized protein RCC_05301 [Ramularia collo-cygni]